MSAEFNTIEYGRPEFFQAAALANSLLRMADSARENGNTDMVAECNIRATLEVRKAARKLAELRDAYAADLARMERIIKSIQEFEVTDEL